MNLLLSNDKLTRFAKSGDYATTNDIALDGTMAATASALLGWLVGQIASGESVAQVMIEPAGFAGDLDEEGHATETRPRLSAAVTVNAAAGSRTFSVSSESLPIELRDGLLNAWAQLEAMP